MIDLDHFKKLNDRYGHATGDRVLRAVGERSRSAVRAEDTPARYGGEEFAVVLRRATRAGRRDRRAHPHARSRTSRRARLGIDEQVTVSVGVAVAEVHAGEIPVLLAAADEALYSAKRQGRNRVVRAT